MLQQPAPEASQTLNFGTFRLLRTQRQLLDRGTPVRLGSRALDLLIALVDRPGEVVSRRDLESFVWPRTVVEETSLRAHISALRKALGDGVDGARYITNIPGRGYCFVAAVSKEAEPQAIHSPSSLPSSPPSSIAPPLLPLPFTRTRLIGRDDALQSLSTMLAERRLVTVTGPGGMGKTSTALAVADALSATYRDGVRFVDFTPVADPALLAGTVALALGVTGTSPDLPTAHTALAAYLADSHMLLVLDNCEHVIEAAAALVEMLLTATSELSILITSREPLNVADEWVYRLASLQLPPAAGLLSAAQVLESAAAQLFVLRASAASEAFALTDHLAPALRDVCCRLDGIPLAIELAAARIDALGLEGLASRIDEHLLLLTRGRRTAIPRHRTLRALIDWSYALLPPFEQAVLRRLAVFKAGFTLESAAALATAEATDGTAAADVVLNLAAKSLVAIETTDADTHGVRYRMLETTRAFAMEQLLQSEEHRAVFHRYAAHVLVLLSNSEMDWDRMPRSLWVGTYAHLMDDVRAALDWCFAPEGDLSIGVALTAAAVEPVRELGLLDGFHKRVETALARIHLLPTPQPLLELRLNAALSFNSGHSARPQSDEANFLKKTLELAEQLGQPRYQIAALYSTWVGTFGTGNYLAANAAAHQVRDLGERTQDRFAMLLGDRLCAQALHFMGEYETSTRLAHEVLRQRDVHLPAIYASPVSRPISMGIVLSRTLWLQGFADQAAAKAAECVERAAHEHPIAHMQTIGIAACPIAFWSGNLTEAEQWAKRLQALARSHASSYWAAWAQSYLAVVALGDAWANPGAATALPLEIQHTKVMDCVGTLGGAFVHRATLARAENGLAGWCAPEILRVQGERLRLENAETSAAQAEAVLKQSLALAQQQGALAWELRTACSLAQLWHSQGHTESARDLVATCFSLFSEGFATADLRAAHQLLATLNAELDVNTRLHA